MTAVVTLILVHYLIPAFGPYDCIVKHFKYEFISNLRALSKGALKQGPCTCSEVLSYRTDLGTKRTYQIWYVHIPRSVLTRTDLFET